MSLLLAAGGSASSITGTLAATLDDVSVLSSGVLGHNGTLAATLDGVAVASSGTVGHSGSLTATLDGIAFDASGSVTSGISGTLVAVLDGISFSASGGVETGTGKQGGDDYPGWDRKAWQRKKQQEDALEQTITETYQRIMGIAPTPQVVKEIREATEPAVEQTQEVDLVVFEQRIVLIQAAVTQLLEDEDEEALLMLI